jgi:hypothetical protein
MVWDSLQQERSDVNQMSLLGEAVEMKFEGQEPRCPHQQSLLKSKRDAEAYQPLFLNAQ